jgi:hypothetical protein
MLRCSEKIAMEGRAPQVSDERRRFQADRYSWVLESRGQGGGGSARGRQTFARGDRADYLVLLPASFLEDRRQICLARGCWPRFFLRVRVLLCFAKERATEIAVREPMRRNLLKTYDLNLSQRGQR